MNKASSTYFILFFAILVFAWENYPKKAHLLLIWFVVFVIVFAVYLALEKYLFEQTGTPTRTRRDF